MQTQAGEMGWGVYVTPWHEMACRQSHDSKKWSYLHNETTVLLGVNVISPPHTTKTTHKCGILRSGLCLLRARRLFWSSWEERKIDLESEARRAAKQGLGNGRALP